MYDRTWLADPTPPPTFFQSLARAHHSESNWLLRGRLHWLRHLQGTTEHVPQRKRESLSMPRGVSSWPAKGPGLRLSLHIHPANLYPYFQGTQRGSAEWGTPWALPETSIWRRGWDSGKTKNYPKFEELSVNMIDDDGWWKSQKVTASHLKRSHVAGGISALTNGMKTDTLGSHSPGDSRSFQTGLSWVVGCMECACPVLQRELHSRIGIWSWENGDWTSGQALDIGGNAGPQTGSGPRKGIGLWPFLCQPPYLAGEALATTSYLTGCL